MSNQVLVVIAGPDQGRVFPLTPGEVLLIGRSRSSGTRLADPRVSKVHCRVEWDGACPVLVDDDSTGGTFANGVRVTSRQPLQAGVIIRIGGTQLRLQEDGPPDAKDQEAKTVVGTAPGALLAAASGAGPLQGLLGKSLSHYTIESLAAKGRSGAVFRARDNRDNRPVALKVLWPEFSRDDEGVQRLVRAMQTMLPLRHPNLVAVYGAGKTGGHCWIAMEFVGGQNLAEKVRHGRAAGRLDWRDALRVAVHVGRALEHAHRHAIIHRNVTPENVLLREADGLAKLGDLVLAKALEGMLAAKITRPGDMVGDMEYMAPERTGAEGEVDTRSDLYSLGALVYAALTGGPPFKGNSIPETVALIRDSEPAAPSMAQPGIPSDLQAVVLRLLAKQPDDRFETATEVVQELERIAGRQAVAV
jgi:serine/threonine-protein kinase